jgi:hypothetical protein
MEMATGRAENGRVAGRVEVMTPSPIVLPRPGSPRARAQALLDNRGWLVGLAIVWVAFAVFQGSPALRAASSGREIPRRLGGGRDRAPKID